MEPMTNRSPAGSGPMTVADLEGMPEDGRRYELIDGTLIVSPAPGLRHQVVAGEICALLRSARPADLLVLSAPFAVRSGDAVELQPDVLVGRATDFTDSHLPEPPLLAVEVLSPSTAISDLNTKKAAYERMGVPSYWVIDPIEVTLTVLELEDDRYIVAAVVSGSENFVAQRPFAVAVRPLELLSQGH